MCSIEDARYLVVLLPLRDSLSYLLNYASSIRARDEVALLLEQRVLVECDDEITAECPESVQSSRCSAKLYLQVERDGLDSYQDLASSRLGDGS